MPAYQLAQINVARLIAPLDDPRTADFVAQLDPINKLAESSPGFVWRLKSESGSAVDIPFGEDPFVIVNMSVWESLDFLSAFTYRSHHAGAFRDRYRWFEKTTTPKYCLWWVAAGHRPTLQEGKRRLEYYLQNGSTATAFSFSQPHPAPSPELVPA